MRIAVASEGERITQHFGYCKNFNIYDVGDGKIIKSQSVTSPGHKPGLLPNFLNDLGVEIVISGGMGGGAIDIFNEKGIKVITGVQGNAREIAEKYLEGKLEYSGEACKEKRA